mmetsp:Transcript_24586/g.53649  ORF Transcript_24586/g.53649 Transcript_24586/m.53649 type:complete len:494 (-) Transcript_24586:297-1778(-)
MSDLPPGLYRSMSYDCPPPPRALARRRLHGSKLTLGMLLGGLLVGFMLLAPPRLGHLAEEGLSSELGRPLLELQHRLLAPLHVRQGDLGAGRAGDRPRPRYQIVHGGDGGVLEGVALGLEQRGAAVRARVRARLLPVREHVLLEPPLEVENAALRPAAAVDLVAVLGRHAVRGPLCRAVELRAREQRRADRAVVPLPHGHELGEERLRHLQLRLPLRRPRGRALVAKLRGHDGGESRLVGRSEPPLQPLPQLHRHAVHLLEKCHRLADGVLPGEEDPAVDGHLDVVAPGGGHVEVHAEDVGHGLHHEHVGVQEHDVVVPLLLLEELDARAHARDHLLLLVEILRPKHLHRGALQGGGDLLEVEGGGRVAEHHQAAPRVRDARGLEVHLDHAVHVLRLRVELHPPRDLLRLAQGGVRGFRLGRGGGVHHKRDVGAVGEVLVGRRFALALALGLGLGLGLASDLGLGLGLGLGSSSRLVPGSGSRCPSVWSGSGS